MPNPAADVARRLAQHAEAVCRHYLSKGSRSGRYWQVGDVANTPGQSLYVRLVGPSAGKWTDAATGEHGDLLDLIALNQNLPLKGALDEACRFLALPRPEPEPCSYVRSRARTSLEAARRLFAMAWPIAGTMAEAYLGHRGITAVCHLTALRFHPNCYHPADNAATRNGGPALIAAVTDLQGRITGVQRTWLDPSGCGKAPIATPRRALGSISGNGVRFGQATEVLVAGEGIETVLSLRMVMPAVPMVAALTAGNLAALVLPAGLKHLHIACDADLAGLRGCERLAGRARAVGITVLLLHPRRGDFNDDLRAYGLETLAAGLRAQIAQEEPSPLGRHRPIGTSGSEHDGKRRCKAP
ncbi:MAG: toprim domain-containing protein [Hyphomicrobiaceae bacterium]